MNVLDHWLFMIDFRLSEQVMLYVEVVSERETEVDRTRVGRNTGSLLD